MCVWVCSREGRLSLRIRAHVFSACCNSRCERRQTYIGGVEANRGLISLRASCAFEHSRRDELSRAEPSDAELGDAVRCWRLVCTGQLNYSGGFAIFCLIVSTIAAAAQKWLSARNTRHYVLPIPAHPFRFSRLIPALACLSPFLFLDSLYMHGLLAYLRRI